MKRENLINSIVEAASTFYQCGLKFTDAVNGALNQYKIYYSDDERNSLYRIICSRLGSRGGKVKAVREIGRAHV